LPHAGDTQCAVGCWKPQVDSNAGSHLKLTLAEIDVGDSVAPVIASTAFILSTEM
jgi:hypothetical protein